MAAQDFYFYHKFPTQSIFGRIFFPKKSIFLKLKFGGIIIYLSLRQDATDL